MFGLFLITPNHLAFTVCIFKSYLVLINSHEFVYLTFNNKIIIAILL